MFTLWELKLEKRPKLYSGSACRGSLATAAGAMGLPLREDLVLSVVWDGLVGTACHLGPGVGSDGKQAAFAPNS